MAQGRGVQCHREPGDLLSDESSPPFRGCFVRDPLPEVLVRREGSGEFTEVFSLGYSVRGKSSVISFIRESAVSWGFLSAQG